VGLQGLAGTAEGGHPSVLQLLAFLSVMLQDGSSILLVCVGKASRLPPCVLAVD
jgi:hypothetical protein